MLPLWRDKIRFVLCKNRLIIVHMQGGRRARILAKQTFPCDNPDSGWQSVLALLKSALAGSQWKKADAQVVLSNHFVRFLVLPWNETGLSDAEKMALVQHRFGEVYGEGEQGWEFRLNEGAFGTPSLASAIPAELLSQLKELFTATPLRLKSVQPYLMTAFNACRHELRKEEGWFVLAERDTFCVGLLQGGQWSSIRLRRVVTDWYEEALQLLEREALLAPQGNNFNKVFVYAPEIAGAASVKRGPWLIRRLESNLPSGIAQMERANFAMAMAGV